uniref:Solute carrier family 26 member 6, like 1 n=1 Tax=Gadus morhua TaxID=8049 RepID=A0A8C5CWM9_GADMO
MGTTYRSGKYRVERDLLDEEGLEAIAQRKIYSDTHPRLTERLKDSLSLPVLYWLPRYSIWEYGMPDLISGISVGIMHLPQGMAYSLLASLPPVFGLYTSLYPALVYFFFGTSRHISIGTFAVLSIMVGGVTERLAPDSNFLIANGTNLTAGQVDIQARDLYRVQVAAATTVLGGLIQVVLGLVRFGFVGTYLSEPLVRAYTTAAAAHAVVAQLKYIFGVSPKRFSGPLSLVYTLVDVCSLLTKTHLPTLVVSAVSMTFLISAKELNSFLSPKLPVPIPVELITVSGVDLNEVVGDAFALAIVGYAISISLGKTFALKHGYKVDSNQELVALGLSNAVGGFFQCYSVCSSMSRSLIQESTGGKTQMAGIVSAVIVLVTILKLGPLFQELPKAVLAAIVFVNLKGMFKQYSDIPQLWRNNKIDLAVWLVTWVATMLFNLDLGLAASIVFALLTVIFRTQLPTYSVLGQIPGTDLYEDIETHRGVKEIPGITIFRSSSTVYFANADLYLEALKEKSGLDISKMIIYKRREEAKQRRRERRAERRAQRQAKREVLLITTDRHCNTNEQGRWEYLKGGAPDCASLGSVSELQDEGSSSEDTLSRDLERVSLGSLGKWTWDVHSIVLDLSTANFIDTVAIKTLRSIFRDFDEISVDVYMAGCQAKVVEHLEVGGFFTESVTKRHLFVSVHDAVLYCQNHRPPGPRRPGRSVRPAAGIGPAAGSRGQC